MRFVASLALRGVRARRGSGLAAGLGIAAAAAVLVVVLVGATVARDRSIAQSVERLPEPSQSVRAVWFGVPSGETEAWRALDASARAALAGTPLPSPTSIVLVRESTIAGRFVGLAAVDGLAPYVELHSGRLPRRCRPAHCEVLRLRGAGRLPDVPGLRIVEVGRASLRSRKLFGDFLEPSDSALGAARLAPALRGAGRYHSPPPGPLVVAEGVGGLVASPGLVRSYRSYAWVSPLGDGVPRAWSVERLLGDVAQARARLAAESTSWSLLDPRQELLAAHRSVTIAGRRLVLVGGEGVALLIAFALLAAGGIRHELERARRRLTWSGASRGQTALLGLVESALIGFGGTIIGVVAGVSIAAVSARAAGAPVWETLRASALGPGGLALALVVGAVATLVVWAAASLPRGGSRRVGLGELAAGVAVLVLLVALLGGRLDTDRLAQDGGTAVLLLLLPGLVALVAAVGASRLAPAGARPLARSADRPALRIAATSVARRVGLAGVAVAFLALAVGLALFAETYRSTLSRSEHDAAAFAVPTSFTVEEDLAKLVPVTDAAPLARFEALAGPGTALPVTRMSASAGRANDISGVEVLALPADAVRRLGIWRSDWGVSRGALADLVDRGAGTTLRGAPLAGDAITLRVGPTLLALRLTVRTPDGRVATLTVPPTDPRAPSVLRVPIPRGFRDGELVAVELVPPRIIERGADAGEALRGRLLLSADGLRLGRWLGVGGVRATCAGNGLVVDYLLTPNRQGRLRPEQPSDRSLPVVAVSPALAALAGGVGGTLPLKLDGELVDVKVGAVVDRFPGVAGELVVGNDDALTTAVATVAPGVTRTNEVWLDVPAGDHDRVAAALAAPPFRALRVSDRHAVEQDARRDPLGHGTLLALGASSVVALVLAVIGLALAVRSDLRDDRGELVDLEAQGASPALLRRSIRVRALLVFVGGLVGGLLAGAALAALTARVIQVTARAGVAEPPLATVADPAVLLLGLLGLVVASVVAVGLVSRHCVRGSARPGTRRGQRMSALVELHEVFVVHPTAGGSVGGVAALRGMSLELERDELCVVLGPSGSGKSTLARLVAGLERPSAGRARVAGVDLVAAGRRTLDRYRRETIGYADQHYWRALAAELTAEELVALPLGLRGVAETERRRRAQTLLERVELLDRRDARPSELSGGEQQRIALCAALVHEPAVLVADEPTGELDRASATSVFALLRDLTKAQATTAVVVSHDPASTTIADRVVHVRDGRVSEEERDGGSAVVVGRGGWLRIPEPLLRAAGIATRATVSVGDGAVVLRPLDAPPPEPGVDAPAPAAAGLPVQVDRVMRRFGRVTALPTLTERFEPGTLTVVTGPSGSGKSTLLALLAGLDTPDEGSVRLGDHALSELTRAERADVRRSLVAVAGQTPGLSGFQTAVENVTLALALRDVDAGEREQVARDALARVGLAEHADRRVDALSAGERERVALARALAATPAVLIADEPTARLDSLVTVSMGELLAELARHGTTVICATHDPLLIELADRELRL